MSHFNTSEPDRHRALASRLCERWNIIYSPPFSIRPQGSAQHAATPSGCEGARMRAFASYLAAGGLIVLALSFFGSPGEPGLSVNAWSVVPPGTALQYVDRTRKGDRLNTSRSTIDKRPTSRTPGKILVGCDPAFSPLSIAASANFPGRCDA